MTLRDILERAHCCPELLAFATRAACWCDELEDGGGNWHGAQPSCPAEAQRPILGTFTELWSAIDRHDWLTWLMRHCPDQFEDSWRDAVSALHAVADAYGMVSDEPEGNERGANACRVIRLYVRLRQP